MTTLERVPETWDADRDEQFFRITARLLPRALVEAASALLAGYDDEPAPSSHSRAASGVLGRLPAQAAVRGDDA